MSAESVRLGMESNLQTLTEAASKHDLPRIASFIGTIVPLVSHHEALKAAQRELDITQEDFPDTAEGDAQFVIAMGLGVPCPQGMDGRARQISTSDRQARGNPRMQQSPEEEDRALAARKILLDIFGVSEDELHAQVPQIRVVHGRHQHLHYSYTAPHLPSLVVYEQWMPMYPGHAISLSVGLNTRLLASK